MEMKESEDKKFIIIDGKPYPIELWGEKYGEEPDVDYSWTVLTDYHRKTMKHLLELNVVQYHQPNDGVDFTCTLTPEFKSRCENLYKERNNKPFEWTELFKQIGKEHGVTLRGRLLRDMISLMLFIGKYGAKGQIWLRQNIRHF